MSLGCFHILTVVTDASENVFSVTVGMYFPRDGITVSLKFSRDHQTSVMVVVPTHVPLVLLSP